MMVASMSDQPVEGSYIPTSGLAGRTPRPSAPHGSLVVATAAIVADKGLPNLLLRIDVSRSQELIDERILALQNAIDARPLDSSFELKNLFDPAEWQVQVVDQKLDKSVTQAFKKRIRGWEGAEDPRLTNVEVGGVRTSGRERMFKRIDGDHQTT
jgi:hypothetical protein